MPRRHLMFGHRGRRTSGPASTSTPPPGSISLDTYLGSVTTAAPLTAGRGYTVTVTGTVSVWNEPLPVGRPEPDAMFPTDHGPRVSTQVGVDAATLFAHPTDHAETLGPWHQLKVDLGDGSGAQEMVPIGGPFSTPQPGHLYRFALTGRGRPARFLWADWPLTDNYGMLRIDVTAAAAG